MKVLPASHEFVRQVLRDFRVVENGEQWVARLRGEGRFRSALFPQAPGSEQVIVELLPVREWIRPTLLVRWIRAMRLPYLLFSLLPLFLAACAFYATTGSLPLAITASLFASVCLIHIGCNLWGDYEDHLRGVDSPGQSGGSGVIQKLWIPAVHVRNSAAAFFLLGCVLGVALLAQLPLALVGKHLLWLGLLGAFAAASYSGWPFHYKYLGLGEPIVFFLSGPLVTIGASLVFFQDASLFPRFALLSLPLAFLAVLRLHAGNMQRIPFDSIARSFTIARFFGFPWSQKAYGFLLLAPFLTVSALVLAGVARPAALLTFLALPIAGFALKPLRKAKGPLDPACSELRQYAARLQLVFGFLYGSSFLL